MYTVVINDKFDWRNRKTYTFDDIDVARKFFYDNVVDGVGGCAYDENNMSILNKYSYLDKGFDPYAYPLD